MKNMTPNEQNDLAQELDADTLPVHKDVVAALVKWHRFWPKMKGPSEARAENLWREINTNPLPKPPEPPLHEQVLAELGDGWFVEQRNRFCHVFLHGGKVGWISKSNPNTPTQIANALRVLAGEN